MSLTNARNQSPSIEELRKTVYEIVSQIPRGKVLTYGAIALLAGYPDHSRLVGRIMRDAPDGQLPCHRVVSASGRLAPHYPAQAELLAAEGVKLSPSGKVPLKTYLWQID
jgi:methylated-DNA-protein-cysteine methyltransferase-like protein